jgi:hypothetical protein
MNLISATILSIVLAAMPSCTQPNLRKTDNQPQPDVAEQTLTPQAANAINNQLNWPSESQKRLARWYAFHGKSIKGFNASDFVLVDTFHDVEFIQLDVTNMDPVLTKYRIPSPSSKKQLDIYGYGRQLVPEKDGKLELAAQSLESEVALYGMAADKKLRLLFCGTACQFEDAAWVDDDLILVAGNSSEVDKKNHPMLWGIKLSTHAVYRFMHPAELAIEPKSFFNAVIATR